MLKIPNQRLALLVYEQILNLILSREVQPGEHLHERRLAEFLEISRTPLRDTLLILESEGFLVRQGRGGLQVKHIQAADILHALQDRLLLVHAEARMAAG